MRQLRWFLMLSAIFSANYGWGESLDNYRSPCLLAANANSATTNPTINSTPNQPAPNANPVNPTPNSSANANNGQPSPVESTNAGGEHQTTVLDESGNLKVIEKDNSAAEQPESKSGPTTPGMSAEMPNQAPSAPASPPTKETPNMLNRPTAPANPAVPSTPAVPPTSTPSAPPTNPATPAVPPAAAAPATPAAPGVISPSLTEPQQKPAPTPTDAQRINAMGAS